MLQSTQFILRKRRTVAGGRVSARGPEAVRPVVIHPFAPTIPSETADDIALSTTTQRVSNPLLITRPISTVSGNPSPSAATAHPPIVVHLSPSAAAYRRLHEARRSEWAGRIALTEGRLKRAMQRYVALLGSQEALGARRSEKKMQGAEQLQAQLGEQQRKHRERLRRLNRIQSTPSADRHPDIEARTEGVRSSSTTAATCIDGLPSMDIMFADAERLVRRNQNSDSAHTEVKNEVPEGEYDSSVMCELGAIVVEEAPFCTSPPSIASPTSPPSSAFVAFAIERLKVLQQHVTPSRKGLTDAAFGGEAKQRSRSKVGKVPPLPPSVESRLLQLSIEFQMLPKDMRAVFEAMSSHCNSTSNRRESGDGRLVGGLANTSAGAGRSSTSFYQELEAFVNFTVSTVKELTQTGIIPPQNHQRDATRDGGTSNANGGVVDDVLSAVLRIVPHQWMRMSAEEKQVWYPREGDPNHDESSIEVAVHTKRKPERRPRKGSLPSSFSVLTDAFNEGRVSKSAANYDVGAEDRILRSQNTIKEMTKGGKQTRPKANPTKEASADHPPPADDAIDWLSRMGGL